METLNITFLGTGNAVPTKLRNHTSILVNFKGESFLFDCGEGTQRQFKLAEISPAKLTKIFITHWHGDHVLGLPGLLQTLAMNNYSRTLEIYGPRGTKNNMEALESIFRDFRINYIVKEISDTTIDFKEYAIEAKTMDHGIQCLAYSLIIKDKIRIIKSKLKKLKLPNSPLIKQLQQGKDITFNDKLIKAKSVTYTEKGKKLTIILDTSYTEKAVELAKGSNILITESSFSIEEEAQAKEYKHLTSKDAATIAKKSKSLKLVLTHISQRYEHNLKQIEKEAKKVFKNTIIAKDLLQLNM